MPKFKTGDSIVPTHYAANYERIVIGTTSNGRVVYEYRDNRNSICIGDAQEDTFKLKPTKKEGWINIYPHFTHGGCCGGIVFDTEQEAKAFSDEKKATIKIEWEE